MKRIRMIRKKIDKIDKNILKELIKIKRKDGNLNNCYQYLQITSLLFDRLSCSKLIGQIKNEIGIQIFDSGRFKVVLENIKVVNKLTKGVNLTEQEIDDIWMQIHEKSVNTQKINYKTHNIKEERM